MGNHQTHRHKNRIEPLQQVNTVPVLSDIDHFDIENVFLIWLEIPMNNRINHDDSVQLRHRLRQVFPHIQSFCDFQKCLNHITNAKLNHDQRFILIFSGSVIRSRVMTFYNTPTVALIYFCVYSENYLFYNWIHSNNDKIRGLFNNIDLLYDQLLTDLQMNNNKALLSLPITVFSNNATETSTHIIDADYFWLQLLIELLINMNHHEQAKEQMLNECRSHYHNDENGLKAIELFRRTYTSDQAIRWYTADSFIYRLLNRTLRYRENFDNIFKFRYFIAELHRQLKRIHGNFSARTVYRGQKMNKHELSMFKENHGKCISVNAFLSTTFDEAVARCYAGDGEERPKLESVLFVIHIDDSITNVKPFASIKDYTRFEDEEEVLFSIGSIFKISEHVDQIVGTNIWKIDLKLTSIQNQHVTTLMNYFMDEIYYDTKDIVLGNFLIYMGKYKEAESYLMDIYHRYADENRTPFFLFDLIMSLGLAFHSQFNYIQAEKLYKIALNYRAYQTNLNYLKCQNQLGKLYLDQRNYDSAAFYFYIVQSSLSKYKQENQKKFHLLLAETYINIASLHIEADNAYEFEPKIVFDMLVASKEIYDKLLPENHPLFAQLYYYFGWAYFKKDHSDVRALENLQHAMHIQVLSLPKNHLQRVKIHFRLGKFYFAHEQYSIGLEEFGKILDIQFELLNEFYIKHPFLAETFEEMGNYYMQVDRPIQAYMYFRLAMQSNPDETLKGFLELYVEVCKLSIKNQMDVFAMHDLWNVPGETGDHIRQQQILFYQDSNENILDMILELRQTGVQFSNHGTKLRFEKPLTLQEMRILSNFIRNGSDIRELVFSSLIDVRHGICEDESGLKCLADALTTNDTINELHLFQSSYRSHKNSKDVCQAFATAIKVNQTLKHLTLKNFSSPRMTLLLFDALANYNRTLTHLHISETKILDKAVQHLGEMLKHSKVITEIRLTYTKITSTGGKFIASGLKVNESLIYLDLCHNKIRSDGIRALGDALKSNKTLSTLYITDNRIESSGVQTLGEALSMNQSLKHLYLYDNNIDCIGAKYIATGLKTNETLSLLSLADNKISNAGATALGDTLCINKTLTSFDISNNSRLLSSASLVSDKAIHLTKLYLNGTDLNDYNLQFLVNGLVNSESLLELELSRNKFSANGCTFIGHLLKNNDTLAKLDLSWNALTDAGLKYICEGLAINKGVKVVDLGRCMLTGCGMHYIGEALKVNKVLIQLSLYGNKISESGVVVLKESLVFNGTLERLETDDFKLKEKDRYSQLDKNQLEIVQTQEGIANIVQYLEKNQTKRKHLIATESLNILDELPIDNTPNSNLKYVYNDNGMCIKHIINYYDSSMTNSDAMLHKHYLYQKQILQDGQNFFRAISDCMHGNDNRCEFYRQCAIDYVKANPNEFYEHAWCFHPLSSVDDYLVKMANSSQPADTLLIRSLCHHLNVNLVFHDPIFTPNYFSVNENNRNGKQLHLYMSDHGEYFDSVHSYMQPDEALTDIFISPEQCTENSLFILLRFPKWE